MAARARRARAQTWGRSGGHRAVRRRLREGRWTLEAALERDVPVPVIAASLFRRYESREDNSYGLRLLAALRNQFGGHAVIRADTKASS